MRYTDLTARNASRRNRVGNFVLALTVWLLLVSCGTAHQTSAADNSRADQSEEEFGTQAIWHVADPTEVKSTDLTVHPQVQRVDCASGKTGTIVAADVNYQDDQISIAVRLEPIVGIQTCQGNEQVPYSVELDEPIGQRDLVDAACTTEPASHTTWCGDAVRWSPDSAADPTPPRVTG